MSQRGRQELSRTNSFLSQDQSSLIIQKRSKSKELFHDRFIPDKVTSSYYEMLAKEQKEKINNKNAYNQSQQEDIDPQIQLQNDLNESLREEHSLNRYTSLLKYNLQYTQDNQENLLQSNSFIKNDDEYYKKEQKIFKYKKNCKRQNELILSYSPLKLNDIQSYLNKNENQIRKIQKQPYKILDAPRLRDDFYYNLLDWSVKNVITIGLDNSIYTWSAKTNEAFKLAEFPHTIVTSLSWNPRGILLAAGDDKGDIRIFDTEKNKSLRTIDNHQHRVGTLCWNNNLLTSGSRDSKIFITDLRSPKPFICKFIGHKQEVCGTKWCYDNSTLASGGNDNKVFIWSLKMQKEVTRFSEHVAAVKALDWSPHQYHLLASGGGTSDKCLKFWNLNTLKLINSIDTGSQICNMQFSKNCNEIVTTHGFSMNQVTVWKCQQMQKIATFYGHTQRVLYLASSPDGENIVTGSGDETLRFWRAFPPGKSQYGENIYKSNLDPVNCELR